MKKTKVDLRPVSKIIKERRPLLKKIEVLNKKLKFIGGRGEQYMSIDRLKMLIIELQEELEERKNGKM